MFERDGKYYIHCDGEDIECLPPDEQKMMEEDFEGYLKWKKADLEKKGYSFDNLDDEPEYVYYTEEELAERRKKVDEIMEKMSEAYDELEEFMKETGKSAAEFDWRA